MRKHPSAMPSKKPPLPSVKVRLGRKPPPRQQQQTYRPTIASAECLSANRNEAKRWEVVDCKSRLTPKARWALELIAVDRRGLTEPLLRTYGFTVRMLAGLIRAGLATAQRQTVKAGGQATKVIRIKITETGRQAIES
jgi:hypothetical protein